MRLKVRRSLAREAIRRYRIPLILLAFFLAQWAILFPASNPSWDAAFYYAYARSIVFDGDLRIDNDLQLSYATATPDFAGARPDQLKTESDRVISPFAIGSSLLWLPWLAILRGLAAIGQAAGPLPGTLTGFEWYFTLGLSTLSMILGWLAFWFAYRSALQVSEKSSALLATLTLLFATPLLYYMHAEALFAHATSAFIISVFIYAWWRHFRLPTSYPSALAIGALLGLAILVRWQHLVYLVLPVSTVAGWWFSAPAGQRKGRIRPAILQALLVSMGAAAVVSLQLVHWRLLYGQWITIPQGAAFMDWAAPFWNEVLFSPFRGLLPWMPVFFLALAGLLIQMKKQRQFLLPLLIVLALETYINSAAGDWFAGGGYGPRRFTGEVAILVIGYAALLQSLPQRIRLIAGGLAAVALMLQQWILLRFGLAEAIGGQVLSMSPSYEWSESGYGTFLRQLGSHLGDLVQRPLQFIHWPNSPLGILYGGDVPLRQLTALVGTCLFVGLSWMVIGRFFRRQSTASAPSRWVLLALLGAVLVGADIWLLIWG